MRIAFIHDWEPDYHQEMTWMDGLARAVQIIGQKHEVMFFTCGAKKDIWHHPFFDIHVIPNGFMVEAVKAFKPDVIWHWADTTRPNARPLKTLGVPMALSFAGGTPIRDTYECFDHIFVESTVYLDVFRAEEPRTGITSSIAFGTNTELFKPIDVAKTFDAIFPATYCDWKRHDLLVQACHGMRVCTAGFMYQDHETYCWEEPMKAGFTVLPHVSAHVLRHLYAHSKCCVVTSRDDGGSQRTVLEAMSMNIPVIAMSDSTKTTEYVRDGGGVITDPKPSFVRSAVENVTPTETREYVMDNWSEYRYADNVLKYFGGL